MAAATPEHEPAQYRDVVIKVNQRLALRTARSRMDDRDPSRQPIDTDIQKADKRQPECENRHC